MILENVPKVVGMIYAVIVLLTLVYMFYSNKFNKKIGLVFLIISSIMGFLIFASMFPHQFQLLVLRDTGKFGAPLPLVMIGFSLFIILTLVFGRIFCGYICPIGAVQELLYHIPVKKFKIKSKTLPLVFRGIFFAAFLISGLIFSIGLLDFIGMVDFFNLKVSSIFFFVFLVLLAVSISIYRPFCRFICPYGVLLSLASLKSIFKLQRNNKCIECKKCEKICPTNEGGRNNLKQECYLCNRCRDICPVSAIDYRRKRKQ